MPLTTSSLRPRPTERIEGRWRRIVTDIPVPESIPLLERLRAVEPQSMSAMPPIVWDQAEGFLVRDPYGNQWIDLTSSIVMASAGHAHPRIVEAVRDAAADGLLNTYAFASTKRLALLSKLVALSPIADSKAILFSAGTEATETAMTLMRRHGRSIDRDKVAIVSFANGYHGRTLAAMLAAGNPGPDDWIERARVMHHQIAFPIGMTCPWGHGMERECDESCFAKSIDDLERHGVKGGSICGFIGETLPGWATWPVPPAYARAMRRWADEHDVLICFDEIQCGCGRTGKMFGFEHTDLVPDLFTLGKGVSSSLPVSVVLGRREVMDLAPLGEMSSTHGGNPVCCAAALAALEILEQENLVEASARTGAIVLGALERALAPLGDRLLSVRGKGLFISAQIHDPATGEGDAVLADAIAEQAVLRGVMMFVTGRGLLKVAPPLCIDPQAALEAVQVLEECAREVVRGG
jgi:4-aminobutyrate aminotransferase/(S)-3-amino-2-methylpropionate transaminase